MRWWPLPTLWGERTLTRFTFITWRYTASLWGGAINCEIKEHERMRQCAHGLSINYTAHIHYVGLFNLPHYTHGGYSTHTILRRLCSLSRYIYSYSAPWHMNNRHTRKCCRAEEIAPVRMTAKSCCSHRAGAHAHVLLWCFSQWDAITVTTTSAQSAHTHPAHINPRIMCVVISCSCITRHTLPHYICTQTIDFPQQMCVYVLITFSS